MAKFLTSITKEIEQVGVTAVSKRAGISRQHLYKIIRGTSHPTSENIEALSKAVSCTISVVHSKYYPADPTKEKFLDSIIQLITELYDPAEIWLFGSQGRGDWNSKSDIDLLIVDRARKTVSRGEIYVSATRQKLRESFDVAFATSAELSERTPLSDDVFAKAIREGKLIYKRIVADL